VSELVILLIVTTLMKATMTLIVTVMNQ